MRMLNWPVGNPHTDGEGSYDSQPNPSGMVSFSEFDSIAHDLAFQVLLEDV